MKKKENGLFYMKPQDSFRFLDLDFLDLEF